MRFFTLLNISGQCTPKPDRVGFAYVRGLKRSDAALFAVPLFKNVLFIKEGVLPGSDAVEAGVDIGGRDRETML